MANRTTKKLRPMTMILFLAHAYIRSDVIGVRLLKYSPARGEVGRSEAR